MQTKIISPKWKHGRPWIAASVLALLMATFPPASEAANAKSPHWKAGACETCHTSAAPTADQVALKTAPGYAVCTECHDGGDASVCRHRSNISVTAEQSSAFEEGFQTSISSGNVVCTTCHEMKPHCSRDVKHKYRNSSFLRGGPFETHEEQCFGCHKKSNYKQRSPHRQVRRDKILEGTCMFCHGVVPQQDASGQWMPVQFTNSGPQSQICNGCHVVGPHPSSSVTGKKGWFHMSVPAGKFAARMEDTVISRGGRLPLDPSSGEITCATCHDPHDRKLEGMPVAKAPGTKAKLRYDNVCGACHDK